ncbi:hypothetical protein FHP25_10935 [Vineibacter terrae]|uniref:SbsA Ig-like domain-containing protein n=1 Tax=Vineibacter terrae TaxID=2586908 RepID=A0A5C8PP27_9HYPH|nr:hypothetical protein [Vineibacter terrae]TXL76707.1 hypothetical protein FHP25_10935 [Vineibacter terrae]
MFLPVTRAGRAALCAAIALGFVFDASAQEAAPKVIGTEPAAGAAIAAGTIVLRVTFDQPMAPGAHSYVTSENGAFPECAFPPRLLPDGRAFEVSCRTAPGTRYALWFNRPPYLNFRSASQVRAAPFELRFSTAASR